MKTSRQMHSMINIDERIFIIGGDHCKKVECLNLHFEDWKKYPDMNYDRREPGVGVVIGVENTYLYVFMGYSNTLRETARHLERLDINVDPVEGKWQLLPIQNPHFFENPYVSHFGVLNFKDGFLIMGGIYNSTCVRSVYYFDLEDYNLKRSIYKLPFDAAFSEKNMFSYDEKDFYLFSFGTLRLIKYDSKQTCLIELIQ